MPRIQTSNPEAVAKRAFFLAWKACKGPVGMGVFQDNPNATEEAVWDNVETQGDYPNSSRSVKAGEAYGDYVFGRVMKLRITWGEDFIDVPDVPLRPDYQSWCFQYPTYKSLIEAAISSLPVQ